MLFISPPFGNYISLPSTISIKGSYTLEPRDGLISQIIKTLRFINYNGQYTWINKIGLRNPGIHYGMKTYNHDTDIISIAIMEKEEIDKFNAIIPKNTNIEINVSCPNTEKSMINDGIQVFLNKQRKWCIIKLSPETDEKLIDNYYSQGFRQFHCSNTLYTNNGGLSGKILIPYNIKLIKFIKNKYEDATIIGGGGIYDYNTLLTYKENGANFFSISTVFFHPTKVLPLLYNYYSNKNLK